ncbi:MAG: methyltransferase domain-containing protein [Anaerolineales bacterium]|nr:methyltransferase domain-containing protein [Anaerolineales bacterium]
MQTLLGKIIRFYDQRVANHYDLHTKAAFAAGRNAAHYHTGIVQFNDQVPASEKDALAWFHERQNAVCDLIWSVATALHSPGRILDMGCGVGGTLQRFQELAERPIETAGITLSSKEQAHAQQHLADAAILAGNMLDDPRLPKQWFSLIVAIESVEHLPGEFIEAFMRQANSLISANGLLIVVARSATSADAAQNTIVSQINDYSLTQLTTSDSYLTAARSAGLTLIGEINLTDQATRYWKVRHEHELFQNSKDGWFEHQMYAAFREGWVNYRLYIWTRD